MDKEMKGRMERERKVRGFEEKEGRAAPTPCIDSEHQYSVACEYTVAVHSCFIFMGTMNNKQQKLYR